MAAVGRLVLMLLSQVWSTRALGMDGYILAMAWYQDCILYSHGPLVADRNCDHQRPFLLKVLQKQCMIGGLRTSATGLHGNGDCMA